MKPAFLMEVLSDFRSLIYPDLCAGCNKCLLKGESLLCVKCLSDLPKLSKSSPEWYEMEIRLKGRLPLASCSAYLRFHRRGIVRNILHNLKYSDCPDLGVRLGCMFGREFRETMEGYEALIPVPLHRVKRARRGYNQSEMIAKGLSEELSIPVLVDVLKKSNSTNSQTKHTRISRWKNVGSSFTLNETPKISAALLVDDVITTGSTMEACAQVLIEAGVKKIGFATLALAC